MFTRFIMFSVLFSCIQAFGQDGPVVTIQNKGEARENSVITFPYDNSLGTKNLWLVDTRSKTSYPVQILKQGEAASIVNIGGGETKKLVVSTGGKNASRAQIVSGKEAVRLLVNGRQVLALQRGKSTPSNDIDSIYRRGGYIHPVISPSGLQVTDDYPLDHKHHHGIWAAWTKTAFQGRNPDFWNVGDKTGAVIFRGFDNLQAGPVLASITAKNSYIDKTATPHTEVLKEDFTVRVFNLPATGKTFYMFDVEMTQQCATAEPLLLLKHIYGGIAFRGNGEWNGKENAIFLTSAGKDRETGNATEAEWARVSGNINGKLTGITIFSHPSNFRAPQPLRIHPKEPYLCFAPSQAEEFSLRPGEQYVGRYRFIVYDGGPDEEFIRRMWNDYKNPLRVIISSGNDER